jgi:hypothetical protein
MLLGRSGKKDHDGVLKLAPDASPPAVPALRGISPNWLRFDGETGLR